MCWPLPQDLREIGHTANMYFKMQMEPALWDSMLSSDIWRDSGWQDGNEEEMSAEGRKKHRSAGWQERGKVPFPSNWSQRITSSTSTGLDSRQNVTFFSLYPSFCLSQGSEVYWRIFVWELAVCTGSLTEVCKCGSGWEGRNTDLWIIGRGLTTAVRSCDTHGCPCSLPVYSHRPLSDISEYFRNHSLSAFFKQDLNNKK